MSKINAEVGHRRTQHNATYRQAPKNEGFNVALRDLARNGEDIEARLFFSERENKEYVLIISEAQKYVV